jgi:hypothetical protein
MKLYRPVSLILGLIFALVGLLFLIIPDEVMEFFNSLSSSWGMAQIPVQNFGFYPLLAVGYMYLVTLLAFLMYRNPGDSRYPMLLLNGKLATAALSLALFFFHGNYLIYLTNFIIDGFIGITILLFYFRMKKQVK